METWKRLSLPEVKSLKARLMLGSTLVAVGILLVTSLTISQTARETASDQARKRAEEVLSYFSAAVSESLAANDQLQVHVLAEAFQKHGVRAIVVAGRDGKVLYATRDDLEEEDVYSVPDMKVLEDGGVLGPEGGRRHLIAPSTSIEAGLGLARAPGRPPGAGREPSGEPTCRNIVQKFRGRWEMPSSATRTTRATTPGRSRTASS